MFKKLNPYVLPDDSFSTELPLIKFIKNMTHFPFYLMKHHFPIWDFSNHGIKEPTYINLIRDPADWLQSHYYYERMNWGKNGETFGRSTKDKEMVGNN